MKSEKEKEETGTDDNAQGGGSGNLGGAKVGQKQTETARQWRLFGRTADIDGTEYTFSSERVCFGHAVPVCVLECGGRS